MARNVFAGGGAANPNLTLVAGIWTFGAGGATLSAGDPSKGIVSISVVSAGRFRITFLETAKLVHAQATIHSASPAVWPYIARFLLSTFSSANKTLEFFTYQVPSIVAPPNGDKVSIECFFTSGVKQ